MFPPPMTFGGPSYEGFDPFEHHPWGPPHHRPCRGPHYLLKERHLPPWAYHHHHPHYNMGPQHRSMGPHHRPMGPHHRPTGPFSHHFVGPCHRPWSQHPSHHGPFSRCPLRGPMNHRRQFFTRPKHFMFASWKLARIMMDVALDFFMTDDEANQGTGDKPQTSGETPQKTSAGQYEKEDQQRENCDIQSGDLWMDNEDGSKTAEVFIGPYAEKEVEVTAEGHNGIRIRASHFHGEKVVASMKRHLPPPFYSSYSISFCHEGPFVLITATKEIEVETGLGTPQEHNLENEPDDN